MNTCSILGRGTSPLQRECFRFRSNRATTRLGPPVSPLNKRISIKSNQLRATASDTDSPQQQDDRIAQTLADLDALLGIEETKEEPLKVRIHPPHTTDICILSVCVWPSHPLVLPPQPLPHHTHSSLPPSHSPKNLPPHPPHQSPLESLQTCYESSLRPRPRERRAVMPLQKSRRK